MTYSLLPCVSSLDVSAWFHVAETFSGQKFVVLSALHKTNKIYYEEIYYTPMRRKKSMDVGCKIWMICLELNRFFYDPSRILQLLNLYGH